MQPGFAPALPMRAHSSSPEITVHFVTLGCAKNDADTRHMQKALAASGLVLVDELAHARVIVLNTCSFIQAAVEESLDAIMELAALPQVASGATRLVVAGCLPSRYGEELERELPEVSVFVPLAEEGQLEGHIRHLFEQREAQDALLEQREAQDTVRAQVAVEVGELHEAHCHADLQPWAYVKISDGCSRHCSYCTIPSIRGPYRSYPYEQIRTEVEELLAQGVREVVLVGQDTGIWQQAPGDAHAGEPQDLPELLAALAADYSFCWFRVMYLQPQGVSHKLLGVMARYGNIAPYLDIPLQHVSETILASMNRSGSAESMIGLVARIRAALPQARLRTTLIAGYPGEHARDVAKLEDFLARAEFDYVGVFPYSRESGTKAATLGGQVSAKTALARAQRIRDLADLIGTRRAETLVGKVIEVLVCAEDEEGWWGRSLYQAPEVDGVVHLSFDLLPADDVSRGTLASGTPASGVLASGVLVGRRVLARVTEAVLYDLYAEVTEIHDR